jgi:hypothetical protein
MEGYLFHSKFRLAGLDLNSCSFTAANESFEQLVQLLNGVSTSTNVIAVERKLVPQRLQVALRIS